MLFDPIKLHKVPDGFGYREEFMKYKFQLHCADV